MSGQALAHTAHTARADRHFVVGDALFNAGDEWSAVCFFYSAYHHVKAALLQDPRFDDPTELHKLHIDLVADDRLVTRHKGRKNAGHGREWGLNELVMLLYPSIVTSYEALHQSSIQVRYYSGLLGGDLDSVRDDVEVARSAAQSGGVLSFS